MAIWLEIKCDVRAPRPPNVEIYRPFCYSDANDDLMDLFKNGGTTAAAAYRVLAKRAIKAGWRFTRKHGWACPNCKTTIGEPP